MPRLSVLFFIAIALVASISRLAVSEDPVEPPADTVLVELFSSQG